MYAWAAQHGTLVCDRKVPHVNTCLWLMGGHSGTTCWVCQQHHYAYGTKLCRRDMDSLCNLLLPYCNVCCCTLLYLAQSRMLLPVVQLKFFAGNLTHKHLTLEVLPAELVDCIVAVLTD